jgi:hypothetical protein
MPKYNQRKTYCDAIVKVDDTHRKWAKKLKTYARKCRGRLTKRDQRRLDALLGLRPYCGAIRASDVPAARKLSSEYVEVVDRFQSRLTGYRWFHITLLADELMVGERSPTLLLRRLKGKADKELRELRLNGVGVIDVSPLPNYPRKGAGGSFLFHVHILAFTDQPFVLSDARKSLAASRSWTCQLGAKPTHIVEITDKKGVACWWAAYDGKPPHEAKNRVEAPDGSVKLMSTEKGYRGNVAMRLIEGLSQFALRDRFFSVGEGKDLREEVMRRVSRWHRSRYPDIKPVKDFDVRAFWKRFWKASRTKDYVSWSIIGSTL